MWNTRMLSSVVACSLAAAALTACSDDDTTGTVVTVPGSPTIGAATAGNASASIAFTAPSSNGGGTVTGYTASCTGAGATRTGSATASPISVATLTNGTAYSCTVTATNSAGTSAASGAVSVTPAATSGAVTTASVLCPSSGTYAGTYSGTAITSTWAWTCSGTARSLIANGLPNHVVGTFPNAGNPNGITAQTVTFTATLTPTLGTTNRSIGGPGGANVFTLQGVKFDPGTAGTCASTITATSQCNLANGMDTWRIEALGQSAFNFGVDSNKAHVQPGGIYHYHGMPEGLLTNAGATAATPKMVLVGWAGDGFPVYARYCYSTATDATSALKVCRGSFVVDAAADAGRPSVALVPLGAFLSDWTYTAGSGDMDDCNGRFGVTPEFPNGIYYYMATDSYPYFSRCVKGTI
jgi:YHYH protein